MLYAKAAKLAEQTLGAEQVPYSRCIHRSIRIPAMNSLSNPSSWCSPCRRSRPRSMQLETLRTKVNLADVLAERGDFAQAHLLQDPSRCV